jgi:hypothetical protein
MQAHGNIENENILYHHIICYRMGTILCPCTVGCDGTLEEGGTRLEIFVKCM